MKIISVEIIHSNPRAGSYLAVAHATFEDGSRKAVLSWYDDELTFVESDFIGKSRTQVNDMFLERDAAYLRS